MVRLRRHIVAGACVALLVSLLGICRAQQQQKNGTQPQDLLKGISKDVPAVHASFSRVFENPARRDSMAGEFYFFRPRTLHLEIGHPVHQIMVVDNQKNVTKVYYPKKKRGFILEGSRPAKMPIVTGVLAAIQPDYGLSERGFEIYDQETASDTLLTYWRRSEKERERNGSEEGSPQQFVLARQGNRLTRAVLKLPSTDGTATTRFSDHVPTRGGTHPVPTVIETRTVNVAGEAVERIVFRNLEVDPAIPSSVENFKIPNDASVERKEW